MSYLHRVKKGILTEERKNRNEADLHFAIYAKRQYSADFGLRGTISHGSVLPKTRGRGTFKRGTDQITNNPIRNWQSE